MLDYRKFRSEQDDARKQGKLIGVGFSTYIEACSIAPSKVVGSLGAQAGLYESGIVRVHPTGKVTVLTGSHSHGRGTRPPSASSWPTSSAYDRRRRDRPRRHGRDRVRHGDVRQPLGLRRRHRPSTCRISKIKEKGKKIAAHLLEASPGDMEYVNGQFQVKASRARRCRSARSR